MKKIFMKRWMAVVCCLIIVVTTVLQPMSTNEVKAAGGVQFVVDSKICNPDDEVILGTTAPSIYLRGADGQPISVGSFKPGTVKWVVNSKIYSINTDGSVTESGTESKVISLTNIDKDSLSAKIKVNGPGYASLTLMYDDINGGHYAYLLKIIVNFKVDDQTLTSVISSGNAYDDKVMLFDVVGDTKTVFLSYEGISGGSLDTATLLSNNAISITSSDPKVASVTGGKIKSEGAGIAKITVTTNTSSGDSSVPKPLTASFKVLVKPKVSSVSHTVSEDSSSDFTNHLKVPGNISGTTTFYTNAANASKLIWRAYYRTTTSNGLLSLTPISSPNGIISFTPSLVDNTLTVNNAKAGSYAILGYLDSMYVPDKIETGPEGNSIPYVELDFNVVPSIPAYMVMSVGDTYDVTQYLNTAQYSYSYKSSDATIASVSVNGIITAKSAGDAVIQVIDNSTGNKFTMNLTVIDGISLNLTEANIYVQGTLDLEAIVTGNSTVTWSSLTNANNGSDASSIATVTANGTQAVVKGVSAGTAYIVASIKTSTGVIKKAVCKITVSNTVTQIDISPSEISLNKQEPATLNVVYDPNNLQSVPVKWISTDTDIVNVVNSNGGFVNIKAGDKAGSALVIAINTENFIIGTCKVTVKQRVTGISLSATNLSLLKSVGTYQLKATVTPSDATNTNVTWKSTDPTVATVDDSGLVTLLASGSTAIIATSVDDTSVTAVCNLKVGISITAIKLDDSKKVMYTGDSTKLSYTITPANATNTDVTWSTTDSSVASVDSKGNVKAVAAGTAVIILRTADGLYMSTCTITVKEKATGLAFDVTSLELYIGKTYTIKVTPTPATATDYTLTWNSLDAAIASVDANGTVTAKAVGKTMITATTSTGSILYCNITVKAEATGLQLNYTEKKLVIGDYFDLKATIKPSSAASEESIIWVSSKTSVATVSSNGRVKGIKGGTAVITCKTTDGKFTTFCTVTVIERVTSVTLNKTSYKLGLGKTYTLTAKVKTNAASNPKLKWATSNSRVVSVSQKGEITGKIIGTATITVTATDGSGEKDTVAIRVVRNASYITLNRTSVTTVVGRNFSLKATVKPTNATFRTVTWKSSDESVAIVDSTGKVTALKAGNVTIKAAAKDSSGRYAISYVIVQPRVPANSVTILNQNLTMVVGETAVLQKALNPSTSTDYSSWASDNKTVATVTTEGRLTANRPGIANITVMTESGKTATTKVTVVGLNTTNLILEQYSDYTLMVLGITSGVTWDIADSSIAIVTNGKVSTRRVGTTTIIATVNGRRLTCKLTVTKIK